MFLLFKKEVEWRTSDYPGETIHSQTTKWSRNTAVRLLERKKQPAPHTQAPGNSAAACVIREHAINQLTSDLHWGDQEKTEDGPTTRTWMTGKEGNSAWVRNLFLLNRWRSHWITCRTQENHKTSCLRDLSCNLSFLFSFCAYCVHFLFILSFNVVCYWMWFNLCCGPGFIHSLLFYCHLLYGSIKNPGGTRSYSSAAPGPSLRSARAKRRRGETKGSSLFLSGGEAIIILH